MRFEEGLVLDHKLFFKFFTTTPATQFQDLYSERSNKQAIQINQPDPFKALPVHHK